MATANQAAKATKALRGSVKLSNEIIGMMEWMDCGFPKPKGVIAAMRRYLRDIEAFVADVERSAESNVVIHSVARGAMTPRPNG